MLTNAQPWDNLRFDTEGIGEVQRKFFGTLHNTYAFFALYAGIDGWTPESEAPAVADRPELDRWILSRLHTCIAGVEEAFDSFEPTRAGRLVQSFVIPSTLPTGGPYRTDCGTPSWRPGGIWPYA